jgi:hypothetical protein
VLTKKLPHPARRVNAVAGGPNEPFRHRLASRPRVATSLDPVEHHVRGVGAVRVFDPGDIRGDRGFDGVRPAAVPSRPIRRPCRDARKRLGGNPGPAAVVRSQRISGAMKRDHRHRSMLRTPAPRQHVSRTHHPDRGDPIGERAGEHERHVSPVGKPVRVDPRGVDVVGRLQLVDQLRDESDIGSPFDVPDPGPCALDARGVDDDEPLLVGQAVPAAQVPLLDRPSPGTVQADDERRRSRRVVGARDMEEVHPLLARGDDHAVGPIPDLERHRLAQGQHHRQVQENQHDADGGPPPRRAHRCRFQASASGAAESLARGTTRIATSARR